MDGLTNEAWDIAELESFQRIQNEGIRAEFMTPVYQSTTYPGHVSMATGVHPDRHGILHNSFYDRESGFHSYPDDANLIDVPPIWVIAEQEGITTGIYFWVGSETQWNGWQAKYKYAPFDANIKEEEKIDQVIAWLEMPEATRPNLPKATVLPFCARPLFLPLCIFLNFVCFGCNIMLNFLVRLYMDLQWSHP